MQADESELGQPLSYLKDGVSALGRLSRSGLPHIWLGHVLVQTEQAAARPRPKLPYTSKTVLPVVLRASRSAWAWAASARG